MPIIVPDTLAIFEPLYTSTARPKDLFESASDAMFYAAGSVAEQLMGLMKHKASGGYLVMEAGQTDGFVALNQQQAWGLFNPTRNRPMSRTQFDLLHQFNILSWLQARATHYATALGLTHDIKLFLIPSDDGNRNVMIDTYGVSGFGSVTGYLLVRCWPTPKNLQRLDKLLARLMVHQQWATVRDTPLGEQTLGDWLRLEGAAALFVAEQFPDEATPWAVVWQKSADYDDALAMIALSRGVAHYNDVLTNIYGAMLPVGNERPPQIVPLDAETAKYTRDVMQESWHVTEPMAIAAHLYGDDLVARQGYATVGLPAYAGFEIAYRMAAEIAAADQITAAQFAQHLG